MARPEHPASLQTLEGAPPKPLLLGCRFFLNYPSGVLSCARANLRQRREQLKMKPAAGYAGCGASSASRRDTPRHSVCIPGSARHPRVCEARRIHVGRDPGEAIPAGFVSSVPWTTLWGDCLLEASIVAGTLRAASGRRMAGGVSCERVRPGRLGISSAILAGRPAWWPRS